MVPGQQPSRALTLFRVKLKKENLVMCDSKGVIQNDSPNLDETKTGSHIAEY